MNLNRFKYHNVIFSSPPLTKESEDFNIPVESLQAVCDYMQKNKKRDFDTVSAAMETVT